MLVVQKKIPGYTSAQRTDQEVAVDNTDIESEESASDSGEEACETRQRREVGEEMEERGMKNKPALIPDTSVTSEKSKKGHRRKRRKKNKRREKHITIH
ncbi:hypothetical protein ElyMa_002851400 [Elysia marginata]|uniref:Uncharacterized protein n=1 Tax=Elysia marginata TaxID=1093978 RepID=A0AAV4HYJ3_9GAST|nr:hypothetical protein ElyMa_002851400 [Elysia marginata]